MAIINYFPGGGAKGFFPQIIVTTVSGATVTSEAFIKAVTAAVDQAK